VLDPRAEYNRRIGIHQHVISRDEIAHRKIGNAKFAAVIAAIAIAILAISKHSFSAYWLFAPVAVYAALAVLHERVLGAKSRAELAAAFYRKGLMRMDDKWSGTGETGDRFRDPKHTYADDLDLFGRGCLFELLSTARLPMGENFLAQWLCVPSPPAAVVERQSLVAGLRESLDLRESLAVLGAELRVRLNPESLISWAEAKPVLPGAAFRTVCVLLALLATATLALFLLTSAYWPLLLVLILETLIYFFFHKRAKAMIAQVSSNAEGLILFSQILERIEQEPFASSRLQEFVAALKGETKSASRSVRRLASIVYWIDGSDSLLGRFLDLPLLYTIQTALAAESWRKRCGSRVRAWIAIVGEMEALFSLAGYSFEHPNDPFPEFAAGADCHPVFEGEDLGHPLLPSAQCVRNSVRLGDDTRLLLISGSNMSGKSTFLRTVGINAVLANAGAPVRAKSLRLSPLLLGTRIRTTDSLQEGRSNFYTEILRIRQIFDQASGQQPLLFLFDELLEGTNSKDRRIGAEGLLRALLTRRSIGIVTTHDLALTEIAESLGGNVRNAHFQDFVEAGQMRFDYKLRDGVVARSNALELMRLIGLQV
jgi:MutS-like protein